MTHSIRVRSLHPGEAEGRRVGSSEYEIRVRGRVGASVLRHFEGFDTEVEPAETVFRGTLVDQAALHGILEQVQNLGLELIEVRRLRPGR